VITVSNILPFAKNRTAPTKIEKQLYAKIDTWQKQYILTCGTTLGLFYNNLNISVTKKLDKALGYENFGWANEPFITSMQYCTVTLRHWELRYSEFKKGLKRTGMRTVGSEENWPLFLTPIIIVYRRKAVFRLVHEGLTEYWEHAKDCKTHEFFKEDMDKYLGEIPLPPHLKPFPAMIIVLSFCLIISLSGLISIFSIFLVMRSLFLRKYFAQSNRYEVSSIEIYVFGRFKYFSKKVKKL